MDIIEGRDKVTFALTLHIFSERATKRNHGIPTYHQVQWNAKRNCWQCSCGAGCKPHIHTQAASEHVQQQRAVFREVYSDWFFNFA
jgi:hypothetical protein